METSFLIWADEDLILAINGVDLATPIPSTELQDYDSIYYNAYGEVCTDEPEGTITLKIQKGEDSSVYYESNIPWEVVEFVGGRPRSRKPH